MISVTRKVKADKPVAAVAAFLSDFTTTEQWDPGTVSCKRDDIGTLDVGSRFTNVSEFLGRKTTLEYKVTEFSEGKSIKLEGKNKTVTSVDHMQFAADGDATTVTYDVRLTFNGIARFLEPALKLAFGRVANQAAEGMRKALAAL